MSSRRSEKGRAKLPLCPFFIERPQSFRPLKTGSSTILAHWKRGLTTAFMEGLNSLFSPTKRKARGYRTTKNLLTMLYFVAGKLKVPCY